MAASPARSIRIGETGRHRLADDRRMRVLLFPFIAVVAAFVVGGAFVLAIGDNPIETYRLLIGSALWWPDGIGYTLFLATPLIFTGLAVSVAFRAGLLNIGAEGQLYVAAFATAWVGIVLGPLPAVMLVPLCCVAAIVAGAIWGAIPGLLKARFGSHEVINTIMMNFIAVALVSYFTQYHYRTPGDPIMQTAPIAAQAHIPRLGQIHSRISRAHSAERVVSAGAGRRADSCMCFSGALSGATSCARPAAIRRRRSTAASPSDDRSCWRWPFRVAWPAWSASTKCSAIAIAITTASPTTTASPGLRSRCSDAIIRWASFFAALLFAVLSRGGIPVDAFTQHVTKDIVQILQATIILFVACEALFREPLIRLRRRLRRGRVDG